MLSISPPLKLDSSFTTWMSKADKIVSPGCSEPVHVANKLTASGDSSRIEPEI